MRKDESGSVSVPTICDKRNPGLSALRPEDLLQYLPMALCRRITFVGRDGVTRGTDGYGNSK